MGDLVVDVVGQIRVELAPREIGEKERREAGDVARERAREQVDLEVGDGVEVRLAAAERAKPRVARGVGCRRPRARRSLAGEALFDLAKRVVVLLESGSIGRRGAPSSRARSAPT